MLLGSSGAIGSALSASGESGAVRPSRRCDRRFSLFGVRTGLLRLATSLRRAGESGVDGAAPPPLLAAVLLSASAVTMARMAAAAARAAAASFFSRFILRFLLLNVPLNGDLSQLRFDVLFDAPRCEIDARGVDGALGASLATADDDAAPANTRSPVVAAMAAAAAAASDALVPWLDDDELVRDSGSLSSARLLSMQLTYSVVWSAHWLFSMSAAMRSLLPRGAPLSAMP